MKATEALIAWTAADEEGATAGMVKIGPLITEGQRDWTGPYTNTGGAAYTKVRTMSRIEAVAQTFITFNELVVRDGIPVDVAHKAFLAIDEYAESIAPDIEGARDP